MNRVTRNTIVINENRNIRDDRDRLWPGQNAWIKVFTSMDNLLDRTINQQGLLLPRANVDEAILLVNIRVSKLCSEKILLGERKESGFLNRAWALRVRSFSGASQRFLEHRKPLSKTKLFKYAHSP